MANAKKCDRCGYYFDDTPENRTILPNLVGRRFGEPIKDFKTSSITLYDKCGNGHNLDLCEKCLKAFNSYLNTPSKYMREND